MAYQTIAGAMRSIIVGLNVVGPRVFQNFAPEGITPPYVTYIDDIGSSPQLKGDQQIQAYERQSQIDIFQTYGADDQSIIRAIREAFNGATLNMAVGRGWRTRVDFGNRVPEPNESNLSHYSITVTVVHDSAAV